MHEVVIALGLVLALEGLLYAAFPGAMRRALIAVLESSETSLRVGGIVAAIIGVVIVGLAKHYG